MTVAPRFIPLRTISPARGWRALRHLIYASPLYSLTLVGPVPKALDGIPPDPWPGDPAAAQAMLGGALTVAGRRVPLAADPWKESPEGAIGAQLHGFGWLRDLRALGSEPASRRARALAAGWIAAHGRWGELPWRPDVLGERLANWFANFAFLTGDADGEFAARLLESAARQARHLARVAGSAVPDSSLFLAIKGLVYAAISLPGGDRGLAIGRRLLERELLRQILPDGGHFQRCPSLQLEVLRQLVDTRAALAAANLEVPPLLQTAIDRMAPMLRCFRHGDGRLAVFNRGVEEDDKAVALVLAQTETRGKPLSSAPHTGFNRLAAGRTVIIADTGGPPPRGADRGTHAGTLSFEMSVGRDRVVVNCGARPHGDGGWGQALRATAAHSTVTVDDVHSAEILPGGELGRRPGEVIASRREVDGNLLVEASHDGYRELFGLIHRRSIYVAPDGADVRGEDVLSGTGGHAVAARFHLHPRVQASAVEDGSAVLLRLASGAGWRFRAAGGAIALEDSVYAGDGGEIKRSRQIVVAGRLEGRGAEIKWRFSREGGKP